ncbi:MAG: C1 family peptidase, partial [Terracidiphilus sp.]
AVPIALHAAVVVGYGFAAPPPALNSGSSSVLYMAMKNSWGTSWGENGFFDIYSGVVGDNESMIGVDAPVPPTPAAQVAMCQDLDGAGHCYWGLGSKPQSGCPSTCTSSAEYCAYSGPTQAPAVCLTSASIIPPTPTVTVTPASSSITPAQSLPVTVSVGSVGPTPTGSVTLTGGNYVSAATPLSSGSATFNLPAGSLTPSLCTVNYTLVADYAPDSNSSSIYSIAGGTTNVTVIPPASLALYPWPATLSVNQGSSSTDDIAVAGDCGYSGTVTLSASGLPSGVAASFNPNAFSLTSDYMSVLTLTASASAAVTSSPVTVTITGTSGSQTPSTTIALTVNAAPTFAIAAGTSSLSIAPGATTGNTVAITVTPSNGFTGTVNLTCGVTPVAASDPPTCSLLPGSVTIAGTGAQSSTLTISTTAATSAKSEFKKLLWPSAGTALALLLMGVPRRRRNWLPLLGILALAVTFGVIGCGGGGGNSGGGGGGGNSGGGGGGNTGTTPGTYTVTVTGASGNITGTVGTVTLTVQ